MKKILCILLTIGLLVSCCSGCGIDNAQQTNNNNVQDFEKQPTETPLTVDNISNYLIFTTELSNIDIWENEYVDYPNPDTRGYATIKVKTASKQNVEFSNVNITFKVIAKGDTIGNGWDTIYPKNDSDNVFEGTLSIPYNGVWEESFNIMGEYKTFVYSKPDLTIEITSVSGTAISK